MKTVNILILLLMGFCIQSKSQSNIDFENEFRERKGTIAIVINNGGTEPIIVRDFLVGLYESEQKLLTKQEAARYYPNIKADVIITAKYVAGLKLLTLNELLDKYNIEQQYRSFRVAVDGLVAEEPSTLLASPKYVKTLVVNKDKKFINIITEMHYKTIEYRRNAEKSRQEFKKQVEMRKRNPGN